MKKIYSINNKTYVCKKSENYLCVPSVLEYIIHSEGYSTINKYDIANYFGVGFPKEEICDEVYNYRISTDSYEFGVVLERDSINNMFSFFRIPLMETYVKLLSVERDFVLDFLNDTLREGKHIICGYDYNAIYKIDDKYIGHVSLIYNVNIEKECISLIDPGPVGFGVKHINIDVLYNAIYSAKDGFWVIERGCSSNND